MRIISLIEDPSVIQALPTHLGLWLARARPSSHAHAPPIRDYAAIDLQLHTHAETLCGDPDYTWDDDRQSSRIVKKGVERRPVQFTPEKATVTGEMA
jgi:hypothetical protein